MNKYKVVQNGYKLDLEGNTPKILPLYTVKSQGGKEVAECKTKYLAEKVARGLELEYAASKADLAVSTPTLTAVS